MTTNTFLEQKAKELGFKNFRGVVFIDDFQHMKPMKQECGIYGSKPKSENNHHWCAWYKNGNKLYSFDSYGLPPDDELVKYLKQGDDRKKIIYSTFMIQQFGETICGQYCLKFLDGMNKGYEYEKTILPLVKPETF